MIDRERWSQLRDTPLPPLPAYVEDDGMLNCEGNTAPTVKELCRLMVAASFPPAMGLVIRRRNQEIVRIVTSIGAEVSDGDPD